MSRLRLNDPSLWVSNNTFSESSAVGSSYATVMHLDSQTGNRIVLLQPVEKSASKLFLYGNTGFDIAICGFDSNKQYIGQYTGGFVLAWYSFSNSSIKIVEPVDDVAYLGILLRRTTTSNALLPADVADAGFYMEYATDPSDGQTTDTLNIFGVDYLATPGFKAKDDNSNTLTYIRPTGTKTITSNGTNIDVSAYALADVNVSGGGGGNDFIITLSYNDSTELWEPDCTFSEIQTAYSNDKNIIVVVEDGLPTVCFYNDTEEEFYYLVDEDGLMDNVSYLTKKVYLYTSNSLEMIEEIEYSNAAPQEGDYVLELESVEPNSLTLIPIDNYEDVMAGISNAYDNYHNIWFNTNNGSALGILDHFDYRDNVQPFSIDNKNFEKYTVYNLYWDTSSDFLIRKQIVIGLVNNVFDYAVIGEQTFYYGTSRTSSDLTISGATVTAPAGFYAAAASKSVSSGSATTPATTITANPSISVNSSGLITATASASQSITPTVAAGYISAGTAGTITVSGSTTSQLSTVAGSTITPTESQQTAVAAGKYTTEAVNVAAISSTYVGSGITQRSSTDLTASGATVTVPAGYYESAATKAVASGTEGTPIATKGTVSNHAISVTPSVTNSAGYISGGTKTGTSVSVSASELVSGTLSITSSGTKDVTNYASASVAAGTEGTPSATKGTVSNHSVSVTPSVTNTTGYITGGTKTGTAISVSVSELVSGTYTVDSSGTKDVTNYASASVPSGTAGTPTASKGTVSNHSISVTPSVTNQTGWITGSTKTGTAVTVTASELASGNKAITENGTNIDVVGYSTVSVDVQGGGGNGAKIGTATATPSSASASISFTGLQGEPTSFAIVSAADLTTGASPYKSSAVVFDGQSIHGQYITNTSNAQMTASDSAFTKSYSNGTLTVTGTGTNWQANQYKLMYSYDGSSSNIGTDSVQVGSGATSITFTDLPDEPTAWSCIFKSNIGTSSGYTRALVVVNDGTSIYGMEMGSAAQAEANWSASYSNGSLTISSQSTSIGGYFHQPGYYQLTYVIGGEISIDIEPLTVTQNGTYSESGKAYSPVVVNVPSSGGASIGTVTMTNSSNQAKSINFTLPSGRTPKAFFARLTSQIARSSNSRYYYVFDMRWDGSSSGGVAGNTFYMSSGTLTNITSGYSYSQSGTTFTLSSTGSRSASPGSFYNGTYELVYVY